MTFAIYIHTLCLTESLLHLGEYKIFSDINACSKRSVLDRLMKKSLQKLNRKSPSAIRCIRNLIKSCKILFFLKILLCTINLKPLLTILNLGQEAEKMILGCIFPFTGINRFSENIAHLTPKFC
jgi:hypothetical protein